MDFPDYDLYLSKQQTKTFFLVVLTELCGEYVCLDDEWYDISYCGRDDCSGHEKKITDKKRLAAIALMEIL